MGRFVEDAYIYFIILGIVSFFFVYLFQGVGHIQSFTIMFGIAFLGIGIGLWCLDKRSNRNRAYMR